jgi:hypothetical protein
MQSLESNETNQINEKKTVWKKKRFSEPKISKKKVKKSFIRTENIEPLQNLYDLILPEEGEEEKKVDNDQKIPTEQNKPIIHSPTLDLSGTSFLDPNWWKCRMKNENSDPSSTSSCKDRESFNEKKDRGDEKEGFSANRTFSRGIYTLFSEMSKGIYDTVFSLNKTVDRVIYDYSSEFTKTFSKKTDSKSDIKNDTGIIEEIVKYVIACPIVIIVAYNWFHLLCFVPLSDFSKDEDVNKTRLAKDDNRYNLKEIFQLFNFDDTSLRLIMRFFLGYFIFILYVTDNLFLGNYTFSYFLNLIVGKIFTFIIILAVAFYFVSHFDFYKSIQNAITGKHDTIFYYCITLIGIWFLIRAWMFLKFVVKIIVENKITNIFTLLMVFVIYCGYLTITFILGYFSVAISQIIIVFYLWIHSLFGMMIYNALFGKDGGMLERLNPMTIIENMNLFLRTDLERWYDDLVDCHKPDLMKRLLRFIGHFFFENIFTLTFLFTSVISIAHASYGLKSSSVKQVVFCLLGILITILCLVVWSGTQKVWSEMASQEKGRQDCGDKTTKPTPDSSESSKSSTNPVSSMLNIPMVNQTDILKSGLSKVVDTAGLSNLSPNLVNTASSIIEENLTNTNTTQS